LAYRGFADALRAYQWPHDAQSHAGALAADYDDNFIQYETLAQATSVGRYRAVAYWMSTDSGTRSRAGMRRYPAFAPGVTGSGSPNSSERARSRNPVSAGDADQELDDVGGLLRGEIVIHGAQVGRFDDSIGRASRPQFRIASTLRHD
jgi:hypothetical protein